MEAPVAVGAGIVAVEGADGAEEVLVDGMK